MFMRGRAAARLALAALMITPAIAPASADEPPKTAARDERKSEAPPGLTAREQWLLERVEQLEKRVAELEAQRRGTSAQSVSADRNRQSGWLPQDAGPEVSAPAGAEAATPAGSAVASERPAAISTLGSPEISKPAPAMQETATSRKQAKAEPFAFADFTWLNGNARTKESPLETKYFTPEIRADVSYVYSFNHPKDDTIGGSSEVFRSNEVQVTQLGVGGDFQAENVRARLMTQFGMYSQTTPRNDASPARGQWDLQNAYRYISEAYGGYHFDVLHGINVDAGIFMSYVGLFSYYNFDNWAYQPSYVSSNTPWFFNGLRVQIFPTEHLKLEPWIVNGWQAYGRFNHRPGFGLQVLWRPNGWLSVLGNQYLLGEDTLNAPGRVRYHSDNSV